MIARLICKELLPGKLLLRLALHDATFLALLIHKTKKVTFSKTSVF